MMKRIAINTFLIFHLATNLLLGHAAEFTARYWREASNRSLHDLVGTGSRLEPVCP